MENSGGIRQIMLMNAAKTACGAAIAVTHTAIAAA
jgi:hypothetical protein